MKPRRSLLMLLLICPLALADIPAVTVQVSQTQAWTGQRVVFYVELHAHGTFAGSPRFELPQIPGSVLMKVGAPVVGSREVDGETWMVQTHEFALFTQTPGRFEMPGFAVHFASREGFSGPVLEREAQAPGWSVEIRRPPRSEAIGFLITTPALDVSETWEPLPAATRAGAVFKRTIVQRANSVSGIALAPVDIAVPEGMRVYRGAVEVEDHLERGDFTGERRETLTYLLPQAGSFTLPALAWIWWNPVTQRLDSTTLAAVSFNVAPAASGPGSRFGAGVWVWLSIVAMLGGAGLRWRREVVGWCRQLPRFFNAPERVAARRLLRACRHHDAQAAGAAWFLWRNTQDLVLRPGEDLHAAVLELDHRLYSPAPARQWRGDRLARTFAAHRATIKANTRKMDATVLAELNP
ncbi:MAG: BatD family protein [Pseudomonadales bacterium]|nr:BatD family protein [Pseudomonadales bacterium]